MTLGVDTFFLSGLFTGPRFLLACGDFVGFDPDRCLNVFESEPAYFLMSFGEPDPIGEPHPFGEPDPFGEPHSFGEPDPFGEPHPFGEPDPFGEYDPVR